MESKYAQAKLDFLDTLFHDFENQELDDYTKSHIAKYLSQKDTLRKEIKEFIFKKVQWSLNNPKYSKLTSFLDEFNKEWTKKLNQRIEGKNKDALTSIVNNKNLIAHGNSSTITFPLIKQHYENSKIIIEQLDSIILQESV